MTQPPGGPQASHPRILRRPPPPPAPLQKDFPARLEWFAAAVVTLVIVWLHFHFRQNVGGLWRDEVNELNLSARSLSGMMKDSFPVLMPLLVHGWVIGGLGANDLDLRLLPVLIGLAIPAVFWAAAWVARRSPPLTGLTLFGLNSTVIFWGDSLRAYGLGSLLAALVVVVMWWFLKKPSLIRAGILAATAVLSVQTLYPNAVLLAAAGIGGWLVCWRRKTFAPALAILAAGAAAGVSLLPYLAALGGLVRETAPQRAGLAPQTSWNDFHALTGFPVPQFTYVWLILFVFLAGFGLRKLSAKNSGSGTAAGAAGHGDLTVFAGATALAVAVGFGGFLWLAGIETEVWYFLPPVAAIAACFELCPWPLQRFRRLRVAVFGFIAGTVIIAVPLARRDLDYRLTNVDLVAGQLAQTAAPQDFIVVTPWVFGITFAHYFKGAASWSTQPPVSDLSVHRYDLARGEMENPAAFQPVLERIAATLKAGHRVWVVGSMYIPALGGKPPSVTGQFLVDHSLRLQTMAVKDAGHVYDYEDAVLLAADGWKTNSP